MEEKSPSSKSSIRRIRYRESAWRVHQFEVWSGELVCRAAVLRLRDSLLLWLGGGSGEAATLGEVALGVPRADGALASLLLAAGAGEGGAAVLARRLATALARPVFVCCGGAWDRFSLPLVERALAAEIKSRPECFMS